MSHVPFPPDRSTPEDSGDAIPRDSAPIETRRILIVDPEQLVHGPSWWGRAVVTGDRLQDLPQHVDASVVGTPEGVLVRGTCVCGGRYEALVDERPTLLTHPVHVRTLAALTAMMNGIASLRKHWVPAHLDCADVLASWVDQPGPGVIASGLAHSAHDAMLRNVPRAVRFLGVMPEALLVTAQRDAATYVEALAHGERLPSCIALVRAPAGSLNDSPPDSIVETTVLTLTPPSGDLREQLSAGLRGSTELLGLYQFTLREEARANPERVVGAYAITVSGPDAGPSSTVRGRTARRLERRRRHRSDDLHASTSATAAGCVVQLDIVTPTLGGCAETRPMRLGDRAANPKFMVDVRRPPRGAPLDGVLARPLDENASRLESD